jgi:hypothetical protein
MTWIMTLCFQTRTAERSIDEAARKKGELAPRLTGMLLSVSQQYLSASVMFRCTCFVSLHVAQ